MSTKKEVNSLLSQPLCALVQLWVDDGARTHDTRNHNPMLYQLNYIHHIWDCKCKDYFRNTKNILQVPG